jgi:prepilin signal peptidase PulO-like enzyme (type II secretory pathway)
MQSHSLFLLVTSLVLMSVLIVTAWYDYNHMVIPHEFVFMLGVLAVLSHAVAFYQTGSLQALLTSILAAMFASSFYGALWLISKGKWIGLGDAKLAFVLGLFLTLSGAFSMIVFSFWIGASLSLLLMLLQHIVRSGKKHLPFLHQHLTMKSEVPFAPFMIVSFIIVFFQKADVFSLLNQLFSF